MEQFVVDRLRESLGDRVTTPDRPGLRRRADHVQRDGPAPSRGDRPGPRRRRRGRGGRRGRRPRAPIAVRGGGHSVAGPRDGRRRPRRRPARSARRRRSTRRPASSRRRWRRAGRTSMRAAWRAPPRGRRRDVRRHGRRRPDPRRRDRLADRASQGFTCDNLVRAEVVTAAGETGRRRPGRRSGAALGAARRRRQLRRRHRASSSGRSIQGRSWRATSTTRSAPSKQVLRQLAAVAETAPDALAADGADRPARRGRSTMRLSVRVGVCWPGDIAAGDGGPATVAGRLAGDLRTRSGRWTYPDVQAMSGQLPFGLRHYWKGHFLRDARRVDHRRRSWTRWPQRPDGSSIDPARGDPRAGARRAGGRRRVRPAGGDAGMPAPSAIWEDPTPTTATIAWARATADRLAVGSLTGAGYANYAPVDETIERVRLGFGTERFARLAAIKARYDPDNLFRFNLNIAPAELTAVRVLGRRPGPRSRPPGGRRASRAHRRPAPRAAGPAAPRRRAASRSAPGAPRPARTGRSRPRAADRRPRARRRCAGARRGRRRSSGPRSLGSVVVATWLLFVRVRSAGRCGGQEHTKPDPDDGHDDHEHDEERNRDQRLHRGPWDRLIAGQRSSAVAGSSPRATRNASRVPGGASAGSRTIRPSSARRTMA